MAHFSRTQSWLSLMVADIRFAVWIRIDSEIETLPIIVLIGHEPTSTVCGLLSKWVVTAKKFSSADNTCRNSVHL